MTAEEFRTRWTGHVPKVQDVTGEYAVLVPLVERPEGLCLLYEVRADTLGRQPGEVCFPGGRLEPGEDAVSCALRETWEELGIPRPAVEVVAELDWITAVTSMPTSTPMSRLLVSFSSTPLSLEPAALSRPFPIMSMP